MAIARVAAPIDDVSTYTWLRDLHGDGPPPPHDGESEVSASAPVTPAGHRPPTEPEKTEPDEAADDDDPLLSQTVKSRIDRAALEHEQSSEAPPVVAEQEAAPASGPTELSASGVSNEFFTSVPAEHQDAIEDSAPISSKDEPVYLSEEQIARKDFNKRVVTGVVVLLGIGVVGVVAWRLIRPSDTTPASSAAPTVMASAPELAPRPFTSAAPSATASAAPTASASAEDDEELPDVADPFKELETFANAGQYNKAVPMGKAAIRKDPDNADAYYLLGQCYEALGKMDDARATYRECASTAKKGQYLALCKSSAK